MAYRILRRPWHGRKPFYFLMIFELLGVVANLVLTALAQPDNYRTTLWRIGYDNGFNSNPSMVLYAYANHERLPKIPFVWTQTLTNFNVAISVLSLFILVAKLVATIMRVYFPIIGAAIATSMAALFITSIAGQAGPDYADSRYPSKAAWYIAKSCSYAKPYNAYTSCLMAKGTLAAACYQVFIYLVALGIAIWSLLPNKALDVQNDSDDEDGHGHGKAVASGNASDDELPDKQWELQPQTPQMTYGPVATPRPLLSPRSPSAAATRTAAGFTPGPGVPFTPRTQAFQALERKLPLRYA